MDPKISLVLVTYNEAHFLPECLRRLAFCDELIVVDLGSDDECVRIAESFGAKVYNHPRVPIVEKIHNFALERTSHDWVLFADPDQYYPEGIGGRIKAMITHYADLRLGKVLIPEVTCFGGRPLLHGQKGGVRDRKTLINRREVEVSDLVHHRGKILKEGAIELGLVRQDNEAIQHYWVESIKEAYASARRYLPFEGESRFSVGQRFAWKKMFLDLGYSLQADLINHALLDWRAIQVMIFQLWYTWNANLSLRGYCREHLVAGEKPTERNQGQS